MKALPALTARKVIKALKKPLLKSIIEDDAGLNVEDFLKEV